ncbi:MAG: nucleotidyltransferase domain-containing protein [Sulfurimonas sp.]|nr:nucleotidyltransferase domain-containing protein [Sulfurimonas sp.]PHQ88728.1 MAG: nucleotidyltransferase [Sulfurimonas sp.]
MNKNEIIHYLQERQPYFHNTFRINFIGLFGSFSRGDETKDSDIDILYNIDKDIKLSLFKYLKIASELEGFFHKKVDLVRIDALKPKIREYVQRDLIYV